MQNKNEDKSWEKQGSKSPKISVLFILENIVHIILIIIIQYFFYYNISNISPKELLFDYSNDVLIFSNPKWTIPRQFYSTLQASISRFPINKNTGHPFVILSATTGWPYIWYALNYYCSLRLRVPSNYYLFVALDDESFNELKSRGIPTILYSHKAPKIDITIIRMVVVYQLLKLKVDVLLTDLDMVFFENPFFMFDNVSDFEVSYENFVLLPDYKKHEGYMGNLGYWKVNSNEKTMVFLKNLFDWCLKLNTFDQKAFHEYLKTQKGKWIDDTHFVYNLNDLNMTWSIHYLDNLHITLSNSIFSGQNRRVFSKEALRRNISMPVIFHLAWYWPTRKASVFYEKNAWFVDFPHSKECKTDPPKGTQFFWDNKFDLPDSPEIPRNYPVKKYPPLQ